MEVKILTVSDFVTHVNAILSERPTYRLGGSGTDGTCDCIGLIIGAIRRAGGAWTGTHGSNYAARYEMTDIGQIGALTVGMAVYKAKEPGHADYDLPSKYRSGTDQRDYSHVGVVLSVSPLKIGHVSGPGALIDTKLGKWNYAGRLKKITYKEGTAKMGRIVTPDGNPVKLRSTPDTTKPYIAKIPNGETVNVQSVDGGWASIIAQGKTGYIMAEFLEQNDTEQGGTVQGGIIQAVMDKLDEILREIKKDG